MNRFMLTCVVALLMPLAAGAQSLGRFFFTAPERAGLDVARAAKKQVLSAPAPVVEASPAPLAPPRTVAYGGIVRRSDGRSMLWINDRLTDERDALDGLNLEGRVRADGSVSLFVAETGNPIEIKVGQSVEVHTGKVAERTRRKAEALRSHRTQNGTPQHDHTKDGASSANVDTGSKREAHASVSAQ